MDANEVIAVDREALAAMMESMTAAVAAQVFQACQGGQIVKKAWIAQDDRQVKKYGTKKASWYVCWRDPDRNRHAKSCGPGPEGKRLATEEAARIHAELINGTYGQNTSKTWAELVEEYDVKILSGKSPHTRRQALMSLANFARIVKPGRVSSLTTATVDGFTAQRRQEKARFEEEPVSVASVNADLRNLKAALKVAEDWAYLKAMPKVRMLREPERLPVYVTPQDFAALYRGADHARLPECQGYTAADWWRALLVFVYQATGWRIGQVLALARADLDLDAGTVIARAAADGNKAKRDRLMKLHPLAIDHLRRLAGFGEHVFPWPHDRKTLNTHLHRLCEHAGVAAVGWHSLRKGFGTMNAPRLAPTDLQNLMQHASLGTTQRYYINPLASQDEAVGKLFVPDVLRKAE